MTMVDRGSRFPVASTTFISFDRGCRAEAEYFRPDRYTFWDECAARGWSPLSRGAGLSYAAASFSGSGRAVEHRHFNRLLDFDSSGGILEVESGITLGQIYDFAVRRGMYLSVQPGHPHITVGGCIGSDVHGKNQFRDGTFLSQVESVKLFHPKHGILSLSRSQLPDLFRLTCGGFGLTGNILSARLRLTQAPSQTALMRIIRIGSILDLEDTLPRVAASADTVYSWHNFMAAGESFGCGFIVTGSFASSPVGKAERETFRRPHPRALDSWLGRLPFSLWNQMTTRVFNSLYNVSARVTAREHNISMYDFLFPVSRKAAYFQLFGNRGFHECQIVIPIGRFRSFATVLRDRLHRHTLAVTLASGKLFRGERELLRFTGDGICLAIDFPRGRAGAAFCEFLDEAMIEHGAWPNLIKDSRLTPRVVANAYPEYELFRSLLREFDPHRLYRSELSERLCL